MRKKLENLPIDKDTHKLMHYDSLYYVPNSPFDEFTFLKKLSKIKKKEVKKDSRIN